MITDNEANDERFQERVSICMNDSNLTEAAAIEIARNEKMKRDRAAIVPKQATMKWGR